MADSVYGVRVATSKSGSAYIAGLYGPNGVARKLKDMGMERNEFQKLVKQAALIVAKRATRLAPVQSGRLAESIRGYAGKKVTRNNAPARYLFGGVIIAGPRERGETDSYGKAVSFGRFYKRSDLGSRIGARVFRDSRGVRQENIRTKGNPYIRTARDQTRNDVVRMWNKEIGRWIRKNGFDATGFGGA
jgi:hypothetical protein